MTLSVLMQLKGQWLSAWCLKSFQVLYFFQTALCTQLTQLDNIDLIDFYFSALCLLSWSENVFSTVLDNIYNTLVKAFTLQLHKVKLTILLHHIHIRVKTVSQL